MAGGFDEGVLLALRSGEVSFEEAVRYHDGVLHSLAALLLRRFRGAAHCADEDDAYQICALRMWRAVDEWPGRCSLGAYVYVKVRDGSRQDFRSTQVDHALCGGVRYDGLQTRSNPPQFEERVEGGFAPVRQFLAKRVVERLVSLEGDAGVLARHMLVPTGGKRLDEHIFLDGSYRRLRRLRKQSRACRGKRGAFEVLLQEAYGAHN